MGTGKGVVREKFNLESLQLGETLGQGQGRNEERERRERRMHLPICIGSDQDMEKTKTRSLLLKQEQTDWYTKRTQGRDRK